MAIRIQIRRDKESRWATEDPTLAQGEYGVQLDDTTAEVMGFKIGDGINKWSDLPLYAIGSGVQSVAGLDTDNTDIHNPVVKIAVDGTTITGSGTVADPLVAHGSGGGMGVYFGDGFDSNIVLDGTNTYTNIMSLSGNTYELKRSIYADSLTIETGITLKTKGYGIWVKETLTVKGTLGSQGNNATPSTPPSGDYGTAGTAPFLVTNIDVLLPAIEINGGLGHSGGPPGWGSPGVSISISTYHYGGIGGSGGRGTKGSGFTTRGTVGYVVNGKFLPFSFFKPTLTGNIGKTINGMFIGYVGCPGAGGGSGANLSSGWGGVGGTGGSAPNGVMISAKKIKLEPTGLIISNGGNGANGTSGIGANWTAGSGGGGAGGGVVYIMTSELDYSPSGLIQALGGKGGLSGGFGGGAGAAISAENGNDGTDGYVHINNTSTGLSNFYIGSY